MLIVLLCRRGVTENKFGVASGVANGRCRSCQRQVSELPELFLSLNWSCQKKEISIIWLVSIGEKSRLCKANSVNRAKTEQRPSIEWQGLQSGVPRNIEQVMIVKNISIGKSHLFEDSCSMSMSRLPLFNDNRRRGTKMGIFSRKKVTPHIAVYWTHSE